MCVCTGVGETADKDPLVRARVLEEPAKRVEEDLPLEDNRASHHGSKPEGQPEGMMAEHSQLTEEDPSVAWTLNSTSLEIRGKVGSLPPVDGFTQ